jgi:hypothetical protein
VLPKRPQQQESASKEGSLPENADKSPPLPKRHPNQNQSRVSEDDLGQEQWSRNENTNDDGIFVVAAPPDSEPTTPLGEGQQTYMQPWVDDDVEEDPPHAEVFETDS